MRRVVAGVSILPIYQFTGLKEGADMHKNNFTFTRMVHGERIVDDKCSECAESVLLLPYLHIHVMNFNIHSMFF